MWIFKNYNKMNGIKTNYIFQRIGKKFLKFQMETQKTPSGQNGPK